MSEQVRSNPVARRLPILLVAAISLTATLGAWHSAANLTLVAGLISTLLLTSIVWVLTTTRERAVKLALSMTRSLRDSEAAQRRLARESEAAAKAKDEFLANMSHEIRTPMTAILGFTDVLSERLERGDTVAGCRAIADSVKRNGEHLLSIINDILDLSKIDSSMMEVQIGPTSPAQVMGDLLDMMRERASSKRIELKLEFASSVPAQIESDPVRLRQILLNLLGNAIKFTDEGQVGIHVEWRPAEQVLAFEVWDTGVGISPEDIDRLFNPFAQADSSAAREHGGTGLGLAISKRLADMLGGEISVTSEPGVGSRFALQLSDVRTIGEGMTDRLIRSKPKSISGRSQSTTPFCRVLVAEDGIDNSRLISYLLKSMGVEAEFVENGIEAMERVQSNETADFDVVLMDMQMPKMDGYTATRRLREGGYGGSIVALTAHAMKGDREKCLLAGCDDYLAKPIDRNRLAAVLADRREQRPKAA